MENRDARQEQYEEAALSFLMDEYAERDGERLLEEFALTQKQGNVPQMPETLNDRCKEMIRKEFRKRRNLQLLRKFTEIASKAAVWVLLVVSLAAVSILAADASGLVKISKPLWDGYFVSYHADSVTVHFGPVEGSVTQNGRQISAILQQWIPQRFQRIAEYTTYSPDCVPGIYSFYADGTGNRITLKTRSPGAGLVNVHKDGASVKEIRYLGYDMVLLERENNLQLLWLDVAEGLYYSLSADDISEDLFWNIVDELLAV